MVARQPRKGDSLKCGIIYSEKSVEFLDAVTKPMVTEKLTGIMRSSGCPFYTRFSEVQAGQSYSRNRGQFGGRAEYLSSNRGSKVTTFLKVS